MNFKTIFAISYLYLFSAMSLAQESYSQKVSDKIAVEFSVTPSVCIIRERGQLCEMRVTVHWISTLPINACLYSNDKQLACWKNKKEINEKLDISLQSLMLFSLKNNQTFFAQQEVKVNASQSAKYRRRLRSQWSLF